MFSQGKPGVSGFPQIFSRSCMAATSILRSAARASALARSSQGNSQASPQLEDSLRGTGAMRAPIPASLQDRSNKSAMLVVLNVARQLNKTHFPSQKNFSKKRLSHRLSPHQVVLTSGFPRIKVRCLGQSLRSFRVQSFWVQSFRIRSSRVPRKIIPSGGFRGTALFFAPNGKKARERI